MDGTKITAARKLELGRQIILVGQLVVARGHRGDEAQPRGGI